MRIDLVDPLPQPKDVVITLKWREAQLLEKRLRFPVVAVTALEQEASLVGSDLRSYLRDTVGTL